MKMRRWWRLESTTVGAVDDAVILTYAVRSNAEYEPTDIELFVA